MGLPTWHVKRFVSSGSRRGRAQIRILGSFWITPTGDTTLNAVAIYRIVGGEVSTFATVVVPDALLAPD